MSPYFNKTRRSFLHILGSLSLFVLSRSAHALTKKGVPETFNPLVSSLTRSFIHRESAAIIGLEYLRYRPIEANVHLLVDLICTSRSEQRAELVKADTEKCRELLARQQRQDFEHNRVVKIHGWILSETEARLCALAASI